MLTVLFPTLPPMHYRLWLPALRTYVRSTDWVNRRIIGTVDPKLAQAVREDRAESEARELIRATGLVVELRPADAGISTAERVS